MSVDDLIREWAHTIFFFRRGRNQSEAYSSFFLFARIDVTRAVFVQALKFPEKKHFHAENEFQRERHDDQRQIQRKEKSVRCWTRRRADGFEENETTNQKNRRAEQGREKMTEQCQDTRQSITSEDQQPKTNWS